MTTRTLDPITSRQQQTWSSGDYGRIAWLTVPLADVLCDAVVTSVEADVTSVLPVAAGVAAETASTSAVFSVSGALSA